MSRHRLCNWLTSAIAGSVPLERANDSSISTEQFLRRLRVSIIDRAEGRKGTNDGK